MSAMETGVAIITQLRYTLVQQEEPFQGQHVLDLKPMIALIGNLALEKTLFHQDIRKAEENGGE
jgi:hypothetical protein